MTDKEFKKLLRLKTTRAFLKYLKRRYYNLKTTGGYPFKHKGKEYWLEEDGLYIADGYSLKKLRKMTAV